TVRFLDNAMSFDNSPTSRFMLTMMGAVAELERGFINQRQREGIAIAKERGVYQGKPKNAELRKTLAKLFARGMSAEEAAKVAKCGRATAFRIKKELSEASSGK
ncbi:recombinase family protein, partial [Escherichia coli]